MTKLSGEDVMKVKGRGFLRNRGTDNFSGRVVAPGTVFTAEDFKNLSYIAEHFGNGKLMATARQCVEIPGIPFEKIPEAESYAKAHNLHFGGTGAKVRPIAACKGTTCVFGNCDTQGLAKTLYEAYYLGWSGVTLPHKFKITVGGCPNSCMKPSLNDFGVEGNRVPSYNASDCRGCKVCQVEKSCPVKAATLRGDRLVIDGEACKACGVCIGKCPFGAVAHESETLYRVYVGGTWGKSCRNGTVLSRYYREDELCTLLEKTMLWFRENGYQKERFGLTIDRLGVAAFEKAIEGNDLLLRRDEILAKELLVK